MDDELFKKNDKVTVCLKSGIRIHGLLFARKSNNIKVKIDDQIRTFYFYEIEQVQKKDLKGQKSNEKKVAGADSYQPNGMHENWSVAPGIIDAELGPLLDVISDPIVVWKNDEKYASFVSELVAHEEVAIAGFGFSGGRDSEPSLLAFNLDNRKIVLLDVLKMTRAQLDPFQAAFSDFFASKSVQKIMHGAPLVVDYLVNRHHFAINNVYDTQFVDLFLDEQEGKKSAVNKGLSIKDCLSKHMDSLKNIFPSKKIDENYFKILTPAEVQERPISEDLKTSAVNSVAFLLLLKKKLSSMVLQPFTDAMNRELFSDINPNILFLDS